MKIPFNEVRVGQQLRFSMAEGAPVYTRVPTDLTDTISGGLHAPLIPKTLEYVDSATGEVRSAYVRPDASKAVTIVSTPSKTFTGLTVEQLINQLSKIKNKKMPVLLSANEIKPAPDTVQVMQGQECVLLCDRVREGGRGFKVVK